MQTATIPMPKVDCYHCHVRQINRGQMYCNSCGQPLYLAVIPRKVR